jgi:excisionase family DNA binding protein
MELVAYVAEEGMKTIDGVAPVSSTEQGSGTTEEMTAPIPITEQDRREIQDLYLKIRAAEAKLIGPDGKTQVLPSTLYSFLCQILGDLKDGKSITILQSNAELTTMEAAKLLAVSRQFLIQLLESNQIPFHMVGTHRRVYARDVLAFKAHRDSARRKTLDDLARHEMDEGLYDRVPINDPDAR